MTARPCHICYKLYQEYRGQGLVTKFGEEELSCPHSAEITGEVVKTIRHSCMYVVINMKI